jgi:protocatechuate 3,4-dioxygenase, beta subunit
MIGSRKLSFKLIISMSITLLGPSALAFEVNNKLQDCRVPTKLYFDNYEPMEFPSSNNLLRRPGDFPRGCKEKLIIRGKLVDQRCVPISDAKVYLWHTDSEGKYPYKPLRSIVKESDISAPSSDSSFTGAGSTVTDNKGEFYFVSCFPGKFHLKPPYLDIRVSSKKLPDKDYRFFARRVKENQEYLKLNSPYFADKESYINEIKIILPTVNTIKEF